MSGSFPTYRGTVREERAQQREDLGEWMGSGDARVAAAGLLRRSGLPHGDDHIDDVISEVAASVLARIAREPLDLRHGSTVAAYARRSLGNAVTDIVRGHHETSLDALMDQGLQPTEPEAPPMGSSDHAGDVDTELATLLCRALHTRLQPPRPRPTWSVAAALAFVALTDERVRPATDIRLPDAQHGGAADPTRWAALQYAGRDTCFAQPENGAVRQRRSAALDQLSITLTSAIGLVGIKEDAR